MTRNRKLFLPALVGLLLFGAAPALPTLAQGNPWEAPPLSASEQDLSAATQ